MPNPPLPFALIPADLPPLSDSAAVEILDFLHELLLRFAAHYFAQIHRFHDQQRDIRVNPPVAPQPDDDEPF